MKLLGVKVIIVTNAAGGLNPDYIQHGRHHDHEGPHKSGRNDRGQPADWG